MKKTLLMLCLIGLAISLATPAAAQVYTSKPKVTALIASWCVHCLELERFLTAEKISYTRLDIEKDREGKRRYQVLGGGGVPIVIIGDTVIKGFNKEAIKELLEKPDRRSLYQRTSIAQFFK